MDDKKSVIKLIISIVLVGVSLFALASMFTHSPNDPPFGDFPVNEPVKNYCGKTGAELAGYMLLGLGVTSYIPFFLIGTLGTSFMIRDGIKDIWVKAIGVVLLIACLSPVIYLISGFSFKIIKPEFGGVFGLISAARLVEFFGIIGTCILLGTGLFISLILITDSKIISILRRSSSADEPKSKPKPKSEPRIEPKIEPKASRGPEKKQAAATFGALNLKEFFNFTSVLKRIRIPKFDFKGLIPQNVFKGGGDRASDNNVFEPDFQDRNAPAPENEVVEESEPVVEAEVVEAVEPVEPVVEREKPVAGGAKTREAGSDSIFQSDPVRLKTSKGDNLKPSNEYKTYALPTIDLLEDAAPVIKSDDKEQLMERASVLQLTLKQFNVDVRVVEIEQGPVITMFELELAPGVKVAKIVALSDDLAIALKAPSVRVVAPLPKKSAVGLEVPNTNRRVVRLKEVMETGGPLLKKQKIPLVIGKDVAGNPLIADMTTMPHLLIAGTTGSGKSVCLNTIILSVLCFQRPDQVKLLLVDPKMVEFSPYNDIPHLLAPIVTDMKKAAAILEWAVNKMEERYSLLSRVGVRNIDSYNSLGEKEIRHRLDPHGEADLDDVPFKLPFIILIVDELADLMMVAAKEVEASVIRLSQKSRAVGIHLILATQRPSVNVVTGLIKSNMPSRISFYVASKVDSRTILDQNGAEKLLGSGDMLFLPPGTSKLVRSQGAFVGDEEVHKIVNYLKERAAPEYSPDLKGWNGALKKNNQEEDELYDEAVRVTLETQRGSVSLIQRRLGVGYSRAAKLIDLMADDGFVGEYKGSQAREVLITLEDWEKMCFERDECD